MEETEGPPSGGQPHGGVEEREGRGRSPQSEARGGGSLAEGVSSGGAGGPNGEPYPAGGGGGSYNPVPTRRTIAGARTMG